MTRVGASGTNNGSPTAYQQVHAQNHLQQQAPASPELDATLLNPASDFGAPAAAGAEGEHVPLSRLMFLSPVQSSRSCQASCLRALLQRITASISSVVTLPTLLTARHTVLAHATRLILPLTTRFSQSRLSSSPNNRISSPNSSSKSRHPLAQADNAHVYPPTVAAPCECVFFIAQPVLVRKAALPGVPECSAAQHAAFATTATVSGQEQASSQAYHHPHAAATYQQSQPSSESSASGSPASTLVAIEQHQAQV